MEEKEKNEQQDLKPWTEEDEVKHREAIKKLKSMYIKRRAFARHFNMTPKEFGDLAFNKGKKLKARKDARIANDLRKKEELMAKRSTALRTVADVGEGIAQSADVPFMIGNAIDSGFEYFGKKRPILSAYNKYAPAIGLDSGQKSIPYPSEWVRGKIDKLSDGQSTAEGSTDNENIASEVVKGISGAIGLGGGVKVFGKLLGKKIGNALRLNKLKLKDKEQLLRLGTGGALAGGTGEYLRQKEVHPALNIAGSIGAGILGHSIPGMLKKLPLHKVPVLGDTHYVKDLRAKNLNKRLQKIGIENEYDLDKKVDTDAYEALKDIGVERPPANLVINTPEVNYELDYLSKKPRYSNTINTMGMDADHKFTGKFNDIIAKQLKGTVGSNVTPEVYDSTGSFIKNKIKDTVKQKAKQSDKLYKDADALVKDLPEIKITPVIDKMEALQKRLMDKAFKSGSDKKALDSINEALEGFKNKGSNASLSDIVDLKQTLHKVIKYEIPGGNPLLRDLRNHTDKFLNNTAKAHPSWGNVYKKADSLFSEVHGNKKLGSDLITTILDNTSDGYDVLKALKKPVDIEHVFTNLKLDDFQKNTIKRNLLDKLFKDTSAVSDNPRKHHGAFIKLLENNEKHSLVKYLLGEDGYEEVISKLKPIAKAKVRSGINAVNPSGTARALMNVKRKNFMGHGFWEEKVSDALTAMGVDRLKTLNKNVDHAIKESRKIMPKAGGSGYVNTFILPEKKDLRLRALESAISAYSARHNVKKEKKDGRNSKRR